ncbi:MAG: T9SS type A sorting domain-containing protein [Candidatus Marinimicrobia bacterium]|nr:T9SS type A sorting domain-containing protein [Candidatus Neomarinimicrobiota bacterium]MCF7850953.1 T9SS type A sorting domain-containing protein [Candidatus Neomarinimicrobiota bacterium]MCF7905415.1 T9SS type A sorting domain-containing protein [Candidatus Neomarinimicrobiota bacterium]
MRFFLLLLLPLLALTQVTNFQWPLAPVDQQHRISATFDECREDRDHFHNGTDMPLAPGGNVLSIIAGQVTGIGSDWIRVEDFAYVHVNANPALNVGNTVAKGAVIGTTDSYAHIHLNYGGGASGHPLGNPLLPGKISPFEDPYHPRSPIITLVQDGTQNPFSGSVISGRVDIIAQAADTTDLQSSIDMNNGVYEIGWALYSADKSTLLEGPYYWFKADGYYSNSYINNVYAPGSSTSIYRYIVTNKIYSNGYLDCDQYAPDNYQIAVMSVDTRDNWDTTYVHVSISDQDLVPPGQPLISYVGPDGAGGARIDWIPPTDADLNGYFLEFSFDGETWTSNHGPDILTPDKSSFTIGSFPQDRLVRFRMFAVDDAPIPNYSEVSDTYATRLSNSGEHILIVDGFDRTNGSWTALQHDFAISYAEAIENSGSPASITTVSNEWVTGAGDLASYNSVFWFTGDDSRTDETFSTAEQSAIKTYLAGGGALFASGAEIGYDLSAGSTGDVDFMNNTLHINYAGDDAGSYTVNGAGDYFSGLNLRYGSMPYEEDWPDHFTAWSGGEVILNYGNNLNAGIGFRNATYATLVLGFTFETISGEADRSELVGRALGYFNGTTGIDDYKLPLTSSITDIYPNPFNASVEVKFALEHLADTDIRIFDLRGAEVYHERLSGAQIGSHTWSWFARDNYGNDLPSGTYVIQIEQKGVMSMSEKLLLLK